MLSKAIYNLITLQNASRPLIVNSIRSYSMKHEFMNHVKWFQPKKISATDPTKTGDMAPAIIPEPDEFMMMYQNAEALKNADENTKKLFSVGFQRVEAAKYKYYESMIDKVRRHPYDYGSFECKLAKITAQIRYGQQELEKSDRNKRYKQIIKELADKRKKWLKFLRRYDYKRFEYILEKLDLKYVPTPARDVNYITRKGAIRQITAEHCQKIRQERLDKYRDYLQSKQLDFLNEKIRNLEFIRNEQIECKIPVTITQEQINEVKKQHKELKIRLEEQAEIKRKNEVRDDYEIKL